MAQVSFTSNLSRHVACPPMSLEATNLRQLLDLYFEQHPDVRGYVLDDQRALRHHVVVFIDGEHAKDRVDLSDTIETTSDVYVFQALSGG